MKNIMIRNQEGTAILPLDGMKIYITGGDEEWLIAMRSVINHNLSSVYVGTYDSKNKAVNVLNQICDFINPRGEKGGVFSIPSDNAFI